MENSISPIRVVLTGGPCSGKTTLMNYIKSNYEKTYKEFKEASREVIKDNNSREVSLDLNDIQEQILYKCKRSWKSAGLNMLNIYDRGLHDCLSFWEGVKDTDRFTELDKDLRTHTYDIVISMKPHKSIYSLDSERTETLEESIELHDSIVQDYKDYGHNVVELPLDDIETRYHNFISIVSNLEGTQDTLS